MFSIQSTFSKETSKVTDSDFRLISRANFYNLQYNLKETDDLIEHLKLHKALKGPNYNLKPGYEEP